ncbi:hypothetical protein GGF38_006272, partial [Coemansia sp. RSA 25]
DDERPVGAAQGRGQGDAGRVRRDPRAGARAAARAGSRRAGGGDQQPAGVGAGGVCGHGDAEPRAEPGVPDGVRQRREHADLRADGGGQDQLRVPGDAAHGGAVPLGGERGDCCRRVQDGVHCADEGAGGGDGAVVRCAPGAAGAARGGADGRHAADGAAAARDAADRHDAREVGRGDAQGRRGQLRGAGAAGGGGRDPPAARRARAGAGGGGVPRAAARGGDAAGGARRRAERHAAQPRRRGGVPARAARDGAVLLRRALPAVPAGAGVRRHLGRQARAARRAHGPRVLREGAAPRAARAGAGVCAGARRDAAHGAAAARHG